MLFHFMMGSKVMRWSIKGFAMDDNTNNKISLVNTGLFSVVILVLFVVLHAFLLPMPSFMTRFWQWLFDYYLYLMIVGWPFFHFGLASGGVIWVSLLLIFWGSGWLVKSFPFLAIGTGQAWLYFIIFVWISIGSALSLIELIASV